jgi:hypothetical protein
MRMEDPTFRLLKAILRSVESLRASLDKQTEAINENTKTQNAQRQPDLKPDAKIPIRLPIAVSKRHKAEDADDRRNRRRSDLRLRSRD